MKKGEQIYRAGISITGWKKVQLNAAILHAEFLRSPSKMLRIKGGVLVRRYAMLDSFLIRAVDKHRSFPFVSR
jgi:hypothetical protein